VALQFLDRDSGKGNHRLVKAVEQVEYRRATSSRPTPGGFRQAITRSIADQARHHPYSGAQWIETTTTHVSSRQDACRIWVASRHLEELGERMEMPEDKNPQGIEIAKWPISMETRSGVGGKK